MRDIILIFLCCVVLVIMVNPGRPSEKFYSYSSSYSPTFFVSPPRNGNHSKTKTITRHFEWQDHLKIQRKVSFTIPEPLLKTEIRKFGTTRNITNPFFMKKKGFKIIERHNVFRGNRVRERLVSVVDYEQIFQRNLQHFAEYTKILSQAAGVPPGKDPLVYFLSFTQNINYKLPPPRYKGRFINSFFIPLVVLSERYGDCDSKSLLLAEFLCTTPQALAPDSPGEKVAMVLVRGNGISHALLAVKRKSLPGMTSLHDMKKGNFILLEVTRPGWMPGFVSRSVMDTIKAGFFQFVELN
jgi:hypothetical protein